MALPVTLTEAKRQLRVTNDFENEFIEDAILDAADWIEDYTGHILEEREITETFSSFKRLRLSAWPIEPGDIAVSTVSGGTPSPVDGAWLYAVSRPASVLPALPNRWPGLSAGDFVTVTYTAGYASPDAVPRKMVRAMLVLITGYFEDRSGGEAFKDAEETAKRLCRSYKRWTA